MKIISGLLLSVLATSGACAATSSPPPSEYKRCLSVGEEFCSCESKGPKDIYDECVVLKSIECLNFAKSNAYPNGVTLRDLLNQINQ